MRRSLIAGALAAGLLAAACNGEEPAAPPEPGPTTAASPEAPAVESDLTVPIEDAQAARDELLRIAEELALSEPGEAAIPDFGIGQAWLTTIPELELTGYAVPPDPSTVPIYANIQNAKDVEGEDNPYLVAAAITDTEGGCAGLVAVGYPSLEEFVPVDDPSRCDPLTIAAEGGFETLG